MKLLSRTSLFYIAFSLVAFVIGGFVFSHFLHRIFDDQINDNLEREVKLIEEAILHSDTIPDFRSIYGHLVDVHKSEELKGDRTVWHDTVVFDISSGKFQLFRHLLAEKVISRGNGYSISVLKSLDEKNIITASIVYAMGALFVTLLILLAFLNYSILRRTWDPFYKTLAALDRYNIQSEEPLKLTPSRIREFRMLHAVLEKMAVKIRQDYLSLKEFNEDASHELQTPLAVIKSKLDLLIQNEKLTEEQLRLIRTVYEATNRVTRLNQGLLLISRIDNNQFPRLNDIPMGTLVAKVLENMNELIQFRNILVTKELRGERTVRMNRDLAEILISNLLSNAIRHNIENGRIGILLDEKELVITNTGKELTTDPLLLFDRFRKSDARGESLGLGLSIAKKIALNYGMVLSYRYENQLHSLVLRFA